MTRKLLLAIIMAYTLLAMSCSRTKTKPETERVDTIPMMVMQIRKCSRLYAAECHVHKIVTHEDNLNLSGQFMKKDYNIDLPMGKRKVAIPMDATIKAYIDFADFSEANVRRRGSKIEIVLPDPEIAITGTRIDHKEVKQYVSLLRGNFSDDELTSYERQGRKAIADEMPKTEIVDMARESAARTLIPLIVQMGFDESDITISFRKDFTKADYKRFIDKLSVENGTRKQ